MAIKKRREIRANIPTSSMADIAFLLIVFFMVTTKFDVDRTRVTLPKSSVRSEVPKGSAYVVIYQELSGIWGFKFSDGDQMSQVVPDLTALQSMVVAVAARDNTTPFVIKAEGKTPYQNIDDTMDLLRQNGVQEIVLLTEQRTVKDE